MDVEVEVIEVVPMLEELNVVMGVVVEADNAVMICVI